MRDLMDHAALAMLDIYNGSNQESEPEVPKLISMHDLAAFENKLCSKNRQTHRNIAEIVAASAKGSKHLKWQCRVKFDKDPMSYSYQIMFLNPKVEDCKTLFDALLNDSNRLLFVELDREGKEHNDTSSVQNQFSHQSWGPMKLFQEGIYFAGRKHYFLGGELDKVKYKTGKKSSSSSPTKILAWFFAEKDSLSSSSLLTSTVAARNHLGKLDELIPSKANARLKLGFSPIYGGVTIKEGNIHIIPDIVSDSGNVMTDGCGLISYTLLRDLPYGIYQGQVSGPRGVNTSVPSIVQVRCCSSKGLFKGCLLVIFDTAICPENTVLFRESMKKANGNMFVDDNSEIVLGVVSTFEHPELLESVNKQRDMSDHYIRLNRSLCLLLHHLGVPENWFFERMADEVNNVCKAIEDRKFAYHIVRQALFQTQSEEQDQDCDNDDDASFIAKDQYYSEDDYLNYKPRVPRKLSIAELARDFLINGHELKETYLRQLLKKLQIRKLGYLQKCQLQVRRAIYLVGAPDPYGFLAPNEIFVSLPSDNNSVSKRMLRTNEGYFTGPVVVSRHPMYHPGDLRKLQAVYHPMLAEHLAACSGGTVFFSTKGERSPADQMSGGDYDGDQFIVIYNADIVEAVSEVEPCESDSKNEALPPSPGPTVSHCQDAACRVCQDSFGWDIFRGLLKASQQHFVGRYSNAWVAWADRFAPSDFRAIECAKYANMALDAAKSGVSVPNRRDLLVFEYPHYMCAELGISVEDHQHTFEQGEAASYRKVFNSNSILGILFNKLHEPLAMGISTVDEVLCHLDVLFVQGHEIWNPDRLATRVENPLRRCYNMSECSGKLYDWLPEYIPYLEEWLAHIQKFRKDVSTAYERSSYSVVSSSHDPIQRIKDIHIELFLERSKEFSLEHNIPEAPARNRVAGFVYLATYFSALKFASTNNDKYRFALSYCWDICGLYLHENKRNQCKINNMQPLADPLPRLELVSLFL